MCDPSTSNNDSNNKNNGTNINDKTNDDKKNNDQDAEISSVKVHTSIGHDDYAMVS
jgi:hypothetical protein